MSRKALTEVVYGGTFDPFHKGHQAVCEHFLSLPFVDRLRIVPCYLPALKSASQVAAHHRLSMLQAWRNEHQQVQRIIIDSREIDRNGLSYTAQTWQSLQQEQPEITRVFALGSDAFNCLDRWHQAEWLMQHCRFWVLSRSQTEPLFMWPQLARIASGEQLFYSSQGSFFVDDAVNVALSSTQIRQNGVEQSEVPSSVYAYIKQHSLYQPYGSIT